MTMKKIMLLLVAAFVLTGCASTPKANSEFSAADISFAEEMIPHHEQAILMSEIALTNSTSDEILALARDIKAAQAPEIEAMGGWTGVNPSNHMGHMMDGMLSDEQIQLLRDSEGVTFDRLFLEGMIAHHRETPSHFAHFLASPLPPFGAAKIPLTSRCPMARRD